MASLLLALIAAFAIRLIALTVTLKSRGYVSPEHEPVLIVAIIATALAFVMPPGIFIAVALLIRFFVFMAMMFILMGMDASESLSATITVSIIEAVITTLVLLTPVAPYLAGLTPFMFP